MKLLNVSPKIINIPKEYENYFWELQCGNGVSITYENEGIIEKERILNNKKHLLTRLPLLTSLTTITQLTLTILCIIEGDLIILGTKVVKLKDITENIETIEVKMEQFGKDSITVTLSLTYQFVNCSCIELLDFLTTGLTVNTMVNFVGIPREEVSLRILNDKGSCLAVTTIKQQQNSSYLIFNTSLNNLEISIASKSTGVVQMPFDINTPMVLKLDGYPTGYILLSINVTKGYQRETESVRTMILDTISYQSQTSSSSSSSSIPTTAVIGEESNVITTNSSESILPPNFVYHLQTLLIEGEENTPPNPTLLSSGILNGPLISRLEIPKFPPSFGLNSFYTLPTNKLTTQSQDESKSYHLPTDINGIMITLNEYLTTKLKLRVSILKAHQSSNVNVYNDRETMTESSINLDQTVDEGPCGLYFASGVLYETERTSHSLPYAIKHIDHKGDESIKYLYSCYLEGVIDHVSDMIPNNTFQKGDKITCHVIIYSTYIAPTSSLSTELLPLKENIENQELLPSMSVLSHISSHPEIVTEPELESNSIMRTSLSHQSIPNKSEDNSNLHVIQVLANQLQEKQRVIDRLLDEGVMKAEIISKHAQEISVYQKEIVHLKTKLTEYQAALTYREQESDEAVRLAQDGGKDPNILYQATRQMLINAVMETNIRYNKVNKERLEYKKMMTETSTIKRQFQDIQRSYLELQEANLFQSKYIEKMQKQLEKVETYQSTILMQEKVINKMQTVIESHLKSAAESQKNNNNNNNMNNNNNLNGSLSESLLANQLKNKSSTPVQNQRVETSPSINQNEEVETLKKKCSQLEAQIKSKDIRIESLQEQLTSSSQEAARLIASLRAKLFELELTADSSSKPSSVQQPNGNLSSYNHLVPFHSDLPKRTLSASTNDNNNLNSNNNNNKSNIHSRSITPKNESEIFSDLAGNVFNRKLNTGDSHKSNRDDHDRLKILSRERGNQSENGDTISTTSASKFNETKPPLPHNLNPKSNYLNDAYRPNSKTGSPRPVSPSEISSQPTGDDYSPRIPSTSMRNLFQSHNILNSTNNNNGNISNIGNMNNFDHNNNIDINNFSQRSSRQESRGKVLNNDIYSSPINSSIIPNKSNNHNSNNHLSILSQHPSVNPSPVRSPNQKILQQSSRPSSKQSNNNQLSLSLDASSPTPSLLSLHQNQNNQQPSNEILQILLQSQSKPSSHSVASSPLVPNAPPNDSEDTLDQLLKRKGRNSIRSSRSAESNRS